MTTVYRLASEFDKEYPREKPEKLAARAIRSLTEDDRVDILTNLLASEIEYLRRSRAREVEHRAWQQATSPVQSEDHEARVEARRRDRDAKRARDEEMALLWATDPEAYRRKYTIGGIVEAFEEEIRGEERLKVTAELLTVVFSVGDGRRVSWGEATLEDHRQRIELLAKGVEGSIRTIRLHEYAAKILRETGAQCLNQSGAVVA